MTDTMSPDEIKRVVGEYWHTRAGEYDGAPQHVLATAEFERRWLELLAGLVPAGTLRVVDAGCGTGYLSLLFAVLGHAVTGVDQSPAMLEEARAKGEARGLSVDWRVGDVDALPVDDGSADVVAERHVLWTMPEPLRTLRDWHRALRPGGVLVHVGGDWSNLIPAARRPDDSRVTYDGIADRLPLMGGAPASRVLPLIAEAGFVDAEVTPLEEARYWEAADPDAPTDRYIIRAVRPA